MLRVLVFIVALCGVARAQELEPKARSLTEAAFGRYDREIANRNFLLKINDMIDDARITNVKNARGHLVEAKSDFDRDPSENHLDDVKVAAKRVDSSIDAYRSEAKTNMLKIGGGLALAILVVLGGAIWALVRRRR